MGYTKFDYKVKPLGKEAYFPRADDPTKIVVKAFKDVIDASKIWNIKEYRRRLTAEEKARPSIVAYKQGRNVFGASVITAEQMEAVPGGTNESDLKFLAQLNEEWAVQATLDNTTNRIKTLLSMLGDVEVYKNNDFSLWRFNGSQKVMFKVKGQTLILIGDGHE